MRARELIGERVVALDGTSIGEVIDLEIDDQWKVSGLIISLEKDIAKRLGFRIAFRAKGKVPIDIVKGAKRFITLDVEGEDLLEKIEKL